MEAEATIKIGNDYILFPERHKGKGAFGSVMEGISLKHGGIKIAAKRLNNKARKEWNEQGKLKRQIDLVSKLHHPNILRLFEGVQHNGQVYIVSQLCEFDLNALVAREHRIYNEHHKQITQQHGILVQAKVFDTLCQSIDGLYFMKEHGKLIDIVGIMHRDIKPANMLVTKDGIVKLADFDLIKYRDNIQELAVQTQVGTPLYMAPQVIMRTDSKEAEYSNKCDIWSLGVMTLELLTGKHPFHNVTNIADLMMRQRNIDTQPIAVPMHYHQFFRDLIPKMIAFEQRGRLSINEIKGYLDRQRHNIINSIDPYYKLTKIQGTESEAPGRLTQSSMMVIPVVPNAPPIQKQRFKQLAETMEKYCTYLIRRAHLLYQFSLQLAEKCKINDFSSRVVIFFAVGFALKTIQELMTLLKSPRMDFPNGDIIFTADIPADFRQQLDKRIQNLRATLQQQKKSFQDYMNQLVGQIRQMRTELQQHRFVEVRNIIEKYTFDVDWSLKFYLLHLQQFFKKFCRPPGYPFIPDGAWLHLWMGINLFHLNVCLPQDQFKKHNAKSFNQFYKNVPVKAARSGVLNFFPDSNSMEM